MRIILAILLSLPLHARLTLPEIHGLQIQAKELFLDDCYPPEQSDALKHISPVTTTTLCLYMMATDTPRIVIHSALRGQPLTLAHGGFHGSQHLIGVALDFHFEDDTYLLLNRREKLRFFWEHYLNFKAYLETHGLWKKAGVGCYPNQNNPFIHLDTRGYSAKWARLLPSGTNYTGIHKCQEYVEKIL